MRDRGRGFFNSGLIQWLRYRRPLSTTSVRIRLFAGAPCNSNDDNRRHSVRYKVSRVCHAIVYLPAVWEWKKEPFVFFFPPFSFSPTYFLSLPSSLFFPSFSLVFSFLLLFFLFFYKTSRRKRTRTTRRLESEGTAPRFTRMFFITHRVHGTMWPRQLNTCSRASARQYPHKRERACTDVRAHLTMNARHTPEAHALLIT